VDEAEAMIQMCLAAPRDTPRRLVLADWCGEHNELEIEGALRGPHGEAVIRALYADADRLGRSACLRLLWYTAVTFSAPGGRPVTPPALIPVPVDDDPSEPLPDVPRRRTVPWRRPDGFGPTWDRFVYPNDALDALRTVIDTTGDDVR
jgi:hypothetical protein